MKEIRVRVSCLTVIEVEDEMTDDEIDSFVSEYVNEEDMNIYINDVEWWKNE